MPDVPKTQMLDTSELLPGRVILTIVTPDGRKVKHICRTAETSVGRSPACDISLEDPMVSGRHCTIEADTEQGGWRLRDLGSSNGTMLNGEFVEDEWLQDGDRITLGKTILNVRVEEAEAEAPAEEEAPADEGYYEEEAPRSRAGLVVVIIVLVVLVLGGAGAAAFFILGGGEKKIWETYGTQVKAVLAASPCDVIAPQVQSISQLGPVPTNQAKFKKSFFAKDKIILTPADKVANSRLAANDADRVRLFNEGLSYLTAQRTQLDKRIEELKATAAQIENADRRRAIESIEAALLIFSGQADTLMRSWKQAATEAQAYATLFDEMFVKGNPMPLPSFQRFRIAKTAEAILQECQTGILRATTTVNQALTPAG